MAIRSVCVCIHMTPIKIGGLGGVRSYHAFFDATSQDQYGNSFDHHHRFCCSRDCRLLSHRQADVTSPRCCQQAHSTSRTSRLCIREAMPSSSGNALRDSYYCRLSYCSFCSLGNNGLESSQLPAHSDGVHKGSQVRGKHW